MDTDPSAIYQQTESSPCVIGGEKCLNGAFPYELAGSGGAGSTFNKTTDPYNVSTIEGIVGGTSFTIGLDYNQTSTAQTLFSFTADYDVGTDQTFDIQTELQTNNNGVGFSDFLLTGFVIPDGAITVTFSASWFNNDGPDRYFLIGADTVPVPEPATLSLLGMGLLCLGLAKRRRKAA